MIRLAHLGAVLLIAGATPAFGQTDVCIIRGTNGIDENATQRWRDMEARADPAFMKAIAGVWYAEIASPATGQVDYRYHSFQDNGLFDYQDRVCSATGCNDYAGHGLFAGFFTAGRDFTLMLIVSDLNRDRECAGGSGRLTGTDRMVDGTGTTWRRVR